MPPQPTSHIRSLVANLTSDLPLMMPSTGTPRALRGAIRVSPRPFYSPEASLARPRASLRRRVLAYAAIALLAVAGARLLGERGIALPLPCGENLAAACAAP